MKNSCYKNKVKTGIYTTVISDSESTFKRLIITRDIKENKTTMDFFIAGFEYADGKDYLAVLKKDESLELVREYSNPFDKNAVGIYTDEIIHLGYVPKDISHLFASKMEEQKSIKMKVKKINRSKRSDDSTRIEVRCSFESK